MAIDFQVTSTSSIVYFLDWEFADRGLADNTVGVIRKIHYLHTRNWRFTSVVHTSQNINYWKPGRNIHAFTMRNDDELFILTTTHVWLYNLNTSAHSQLALLNLLSPFSDSTSQLRGLKKNLVQLHPVPNRTIL